MDLNDQGDMIDWYLLNPSVSQAAEVPRSFLYHAGHLYRLPHFNALKLNNHGEIAGSVKATGSQDGAAQLLHLAQPLSGSSIAGLC